MRKHFFNLLMGMSMLSFVLLTGYFVQQLSQPPPHDSKPPKREFRAVWVTTLGNMDWPSSSKLSVEEQKKEFIFLLEKCKEANLNAVIVQIRPSGDAFYQSNYEPWSEWLTGKQGHPPSPFFDPLEFMLAETHKRNMEFHAWINPLRAVYHNKFSDIHPSHITKRKPEWFLDYGTMRLFNPGIPEVRHYLIELIGDIVSRYDVDGIHFDDYFYPFPMPDMKLNDEATFRKYANGFGNKKDWRIDNINRLIEGVHLKINAINPRVKFGVSPAGVWRNIEDSPFGSHTRGGYTSFDHLSADCRLWLEKGWIDYIAPQIYFSTSKESVNYRTLVRWWNNNTFGRHLYIGHAAFKIYWESDKSWYNKSEIPMQLQYNRQMKNVKGSAYFRAESFIRNRGNFRDSLSRFYYRSQSLIPPMPWKDGIPPNPPTELSMRFSRQGMSMTWQPPTPAADGEMPYYYVLYRVPFKGDDGENLENGESIRAILPPTATQFVDQEVKSDTAYRYFLSAFDRLHNESQWAIPKKEIVYVMNGKYTVEEFQAYKQYFDARVNQYFGWLGTPYLGQNKQ